MKNVIDISCFILLGTLIAAIDTGPGQAVSQPAPITLDQRVNDWLEDLRRGGSGRQHWLVPENAVCPPSVRSWEIVQSSASGRIVRIESGDEAGVPRETLWQISLDNGKIVSLHRKSTVYH